jgi:hypothetical protein
MYHSKTGALRTHLSRAALALALAAATGLAAAATIHVQIDTSRFGASGGYLDMQLSATSGVPLATALVTNLSGFDPAGSLDQWGVTGTSGGYLFRNDTANDFFRGVSFGGPLSFDLTFDGAPDPLRRYVSRFVVSAFDDGYGLLGTYDQASGALATFSWTPALTAGADGVVGVTLSDAAAVRVGAAPTVSAVPEPGTWLLMGAGCVGAFMARRRASATVGRARSVWARTLRIPSARRDRAKLTNGIARPVSWRALSCAADPHQRPAPLIGYLTQSMST